MVLKILSKRITGKLKPSCVQRKERMLLIIFQIY